MKYIDKSIHLEEGNSYSSDYLCDAFNEEEQCFHPSIATVQTYTNFTCKKYRYAEGLGDASRQGFEPLLVEEQEYYCCYCMGRIESRSVTLEHIIPEKFKEGQIPDKEFAHYATYAPILAENVELAKTFAKRKFSSKEEIRDFKKYPHLISYVNLTASCHGIINKENGTSCFCNHPRGNDRIIPLMLMNDLSSIIGYNQLGSIIIKDYTRTDIEDLKSTIDSLCLNHSTLKEIRMLWYKISRTKKTVEEVTAITLPKDRISLLKLLFNENNYDRIEEKWYKYAPNQPESIYWQLFIKYDWFYSYYRNTIP